MTGVDIRVRVGAALVLRVKRVTIDGAVGEIDETDGESGGFGECDENGVSQADITFEGWMRRADLAPIVEGDLLPDVLVAWDGNVAVPVVNKRHAFPKVKVLKANTTGEVRGGSISYTLTCKSSGPYAPPGVAAFATRSAPAGFSTAVVKDAKDGMTPDSPTIKFARAKPEDKPTPSTPSTPSKKESEMAA